MSYSPATSPVGDGIVVQIEGTFLRPHSSFLAEPSFESRFVCCCCCFVVFTLLV